VSNPVAAQTTITVPTVLFGFSPTVFTAVDVEIGALSGLSQFQINFSGAGSSSAFTFNEGLVFSSAFGGSEIFSLFSSSTSNDGQLGSETGIGSIGTSGNGSVGGGNASSILSATSTTTSITALNPSSTSGKGSSSGAPVVVVTVSVSIVSVHLGASAAPVTMQPTSSILSGADNLPTSLTHFGQDTDIQSRRPFLNSDGVADEPTPFIDFVEPFRPAAPDAAPVGVQARRGDLDPAPRAARIGPLPALSQPSVDAILDLTAGCLIRKSPDNSSSRASDRSDRADYSWNLSTLFGATVVAAGGYHLVMRESDRFHRRAVPRWVGADRPSKRKSGFPLR